MKTIQKLTFSGIDASKEISLLEYGLLVSDQLHLDGSNTRFVVYRINENHFDCGHISEEEINGYVFGKEFPNDEDIASFLSFVGEFKPEEWAKFTFQTKLHDLFSYWGYENIMGTSYYPMTEEEAKERYL